MIKEKEDRILAWLVGSWGSSQGICICSQ